MDIEGLKDKETIIIAKEVYLKEPIKENIISLFHDVDNNVVTIGIYYKLNKHLNRHMGFCLSTGSFFFTDDYSLKATEEEDYRILNNNISSVERVYKNLEQFYKIKTYEALEENDKDTFMKYSKLYKNLKSEMECVK